MKRMGVCGEGGRDKRMEEEASGVETLESR